MTALPTYQGQLTNGLAPVPGYSNSAPGYGGASSTPNTTGSISTPTFPNSTQPTFDTAGYKVDGQDPTAQGIQDFEASQANAPFDPDTIKANTMASFQSEIDALKGVYAQKVQEANQQGANRLGQAGVSQARTGLIGSASQGQQNDTITANNNDIVGGINDELNQKIGAITSQANSDANAAIEAARNAKIAGGTAYLNSITQRDAAKTTSLQKLATTFINQKVDPSQLSSGQIADLVNTFNKAGYNITPSDITDAYTATKASTDAAAAKAAKDNQTTLSQGQEVIGPDGKVVASSAPKPDTSIQANVNGRTVLIDNATGKVIADLGATTSTAGGSGSLDGSNSNSLGTTGPNGQKIPDALAPYYKTSFNGLGYADLSSLTKTDQTKYAQLAVSSGLTPIFDTATSAKLNAISDANANLKDISDATSKISLGKGGLGANVEGALGADNGNIQQGIENSLSGLFGDKDIKSFNAFRTAIINNVQALAGGAGSGLRINQAEIDAALNNDLPVITGIHADTPASAAAKIQRLTTQLNTWEQQLVGGGVHAGSDVTVGQNTPASDATIRVKLSDGQTGSIDPADFDPKTMTKI